MAVAVLRTPFLVLDADNVVVEVGDAAQPVFGYLLGRNVFESFPDAEPLFRPYYDRARHTRKPVEFVQFFEGNVARLRAVPDGDRVQVFWEVLSQLDTLTLTGLRASIDEAISVLEKRERDARRERVRRSLRVVDGAG